MGSTRPVVVGTHGVVAAQHYLAADAGLRMVSAGGNAVDAAVAAVFAEGVVNPHMCTIGGECPIIVYIHKLQRVLVVNGNTVAPRRASIEAFRERGYDSIPGEGILAAGVPVAFDSVALALQNWGTMTLKDVLRPARDLARDGFPVHEGLAGPTEVEDSIFPNREKFLRDWPSTAKIYLPGNEIPVVGSRLRNTDLAQVFDHLMDVEASASHLGREAAIDRARDAFYRGDIAKKIGTFAHEREGFLDSEDLRTYRARVEAPLHYDFGPYRVFKCPPWSQGLVFLQQLALLKEFDPVALGHNSAQYIHTLVEVAKLVFADREKFYGDPAFVRFPWECLLGDGYVRGRAGLIESTASPHLRPGDPELGRALLERDEKTPCPAPGRGTIHVATVDAEKNMVSATASGAWISGSPVVEGLGFPLGTRLQMFSLNPSLPNSLRPGKQPRTTLSPGMALSNGNLYLAFGTMGGDRQDQWALQFFLNVAAFKMGLQDAIEAPRFSTTHFPSSFFPHTASPSTIRIEGRIGYDVRRDLQRRGHRIELRPDWIEGFITSTAVDMGSGTIMGGADPRGEIAGVFPSYAMGY